MDKKIKCFGCQKVIVKTPNKVSLTFSGDGPDYFKTEILDACEECANRLEKNQEKS